MTLGDWCVGAQNDMLYITKGRLPAMNNDYPVHDADSDVIAGPFASSSEREVDALKATCLAHNAEMENLRRHLDHLESDLRHV